MCTLALLLSLMALLLAPAARARELKLATWDLGWFTLRPDGDPSLPDGVLPKRAQDVALLARYAAALHADIVAFQGVDGPDAAALLFPPSDYVIHMTEDAVLQRTGFAVRRDLKLTPEPDVTALDPFVHARYHLRSGADIGLRLQQGGVLRLLSVHLKSGCQTSALTDTDEPACATLALQADALRDWMVARRDAGEPFLLLGDFARVMDGDDAFLAILQQATPLLRATAHRASPCWGGEKFVDHILAGGAAQGWLRPDSLRVMAYRETEAAWRTRLSEHCPVTVRLDLPD
jgi:endonuclease/exonuclease/phosphatase family metal-dependent hydrolase